MYKKEHLQKRVLLDSCRLLYLMKKMNEIDQRLNILPLVIREEYKKAQEDYKKTVNKLLSDSVWDSKETIIPTVFHYEAITHELLRYTELLREYTAEKTGILFN